MDYNVAKIAFWSLLTAHFAWILKIVFAIVRDATGGKMELKGKIGTVADYDIEVQATGKIKISLEVDTLDDLKQLATHAGWTGFAGMIASAEAAVGDLPAQPQG